MSSYTKWDQEHKVGAMTRTMTGDVKKSVQEKIRKLYADEEGNLDEDYRKGCAEWHWNVAAYFKDPEVIDRYTMLIELYFDEKIDPNTDDTWKMLMRRTLPQQFIKKINTIGTQVPIIAVMDDTEMKKEIKEKWE